MTKRKYQLVDAGRYATMAEACYSLGYNPPAQMPAPRSAIKITATRTNEQSGLVRVFPSGHGGVVIDRAHHQTARFLADRILVNW